ncbi:Hsp33 family molecular chaperone HslO [Paracoccus alkenifer]|uniref:Molecular chaperone Hsp33 n=1 Tax=Paracoccus alkenifer TaxID=65735 RepID=A0A1H6M6I3_9RHOB|nr:Hsp33 family molecular chaperone HslO [Paracoccus alkenifer]SEH96958.1 molecular chaperone Hsp33 [Paracoccus alkenifer]
MTSINQIAWDDTVLPFQLDRSGVRGRVARLDGVLDHILTRHDYPPQVAALVAEVALLAALIGPTIKLRWKLSIQVRGNGAIRTLAADYFAPPGEGEPARIRGWASFDAGRLDDDQSGRPPFEQIGEGYFAILIDQGAGNLPYQGITPLAGGSLSACAATYFAQSEQLPSTFTLSYGQSRMAGDAASHWRAGGVMLQTLPAQPAAAGEGGSGEGGLIEAADILQGAESEDWNRANHLLSTVEPIELIGPSVAPTDLLVRLFHEETPRVFDPQRVEFGCSCSADRVRGTLSIYSAKDIAHMTTEAGAVTADCQFCGAHYEFDPESLGFEATLDPEGNPLPEMQEEGRG